MNTNITKTWNVSISEDEVFARCINETLYKASSVDAEGVNEEGLVMQDDDRDQFRMYYTNAVVTLQLILARRMDEPVENNGYDFTFRLQMHDNHDDNILNVLITRCYAYVVKRVLEQWYHADLGSELDKLEIDHCIHYRKKPVRRRVDPLF